jgi:hypothetical protein
LLVRLYVGVKGARRLGPRDEVNIDPGFYRGEQFIRRSRPDASVQGKPSHEFMVKSFMIKSMIGFRQQYCAHLEFTRLCIP